MEGSIIYQLMDEVRLINQLLKQLIERMPLQNREEFKDDEQAFLEFWSQKIPLREYWFKNKPVALARAAWAAGIAWERGRQ